MIHKPWTMKEYALVFREWEAFDPELDKVGEMDKRIAQSIGRTPAAVTRMRDRLRLPTRYTPSDEELYQPTIASKVEKWRKGFIKQSQFRLAQMVDLYEQSGREFDVHHLLAVSDEAYSHFVHGPSGILRNPEKSQPQPDTLKGDVGIDPEAVGFTWKVALSIGMVSGAALTVLGGYIGKYIGL